jgi:hypothetical protein
LLDWSPTKVSSESWCVFLLGSEILGCSKGVPRPVVEPDKGALSLQVKTIVFVKNSIGT